MAFTFAARAFNRQTTELEIGADHIWYFRRF